MRSIAMNLEEDFSYAEGGVAGLRLMGGDVFPGTPVDVVIRRATDTDPFLGPRGWQSNEFRWRSGNSRIEGTDVIIPLGPLVGTWLEDYTPLEFDLPDLDLQGAAVWSDISPPLSEIQSKGRTMGPDWGDSFGTTSPEPEKPTPAPPQTEKPTPTPPQTEKPTPTPPQTEKPTPTPPQTEKPTPTPPRPKQKQLRLWLLAGLLVLFWIGVAATYSLLFIDQEDTTTVSEQPESPPAPVAEAPPRPLTQDERLASAMAAVNRGQPDDAIRELRSLASENHGPTLLYLARAYDSVNFHPGLASKPNDIEALDLYARACEAQAAGAPESLRALESALRERANQGDRVTGETLRLAYPPAAAACGL